MPEIVNHFAIFRIKKMRTSEEISKVGNHNDRLRKLPDNVDPARVKLNHSFIVDERPLLDRVLTRLKGKKIRKDAVKAVEIVCGFSPGCEKFVPVEEWAKASLDFIKRQFGAANLVSAVLHLDEKTPHLQCVIIPLVGEKLAAKRIFGTRKQMRDLQSGYHDTVKKFGLMRGTKGSDRPHLSMAEIYQGTQEGMEIVQKTLDSIPKKSPLEGWKSYSDKLREHLTTALEPLASAKTAATLASLEVQSLRKLVEESDIAYKAAKDRLRALDLTEVATRLLGYNGVKEGKSTVFEDDSRRLIITGHAFKDQKTDARGERGAISLTRHILGIDFEAAVRALAQHFPEEGDIVQAEAVREVESSIKTSVDAAIHEQIDTEAKIDHFAKRDDSKLSVLTEYLEKIKGIPSAIIKSLVANTKLWANRWGSACFLKTTADEARIGVTIIGTSTNSIQSIGAKDAFFHFGGFSKNEPVAVLEHPIDALSYHTKTGTSVMSTDHVADAQEIVSFLKANNVKSVIAAHDADAIGEKLAKALIDEAENAGITTSRAKPPKGQSWNVSLLNPTPTRSNVRKATPPTPEK